MSKDFEAAVGMARATGSVAVTYNGVRVERQPDGTFAQVAGPEAVPADEQTAQGPACTRCRHLRHLHGVSGAHLDPCACCEPPQV